MHTLNVETPTALALRAIQKYDEVVAYDSHRYLLVEAESLLGAELGLECTGVEDGWNDDGSVAYFSHNGNTCPIHEWLVPSDSSDYDNAS